MKTNFLIYLIAIMFAFASCITINNCPMEQKPTTKPPVAQIKSVTKPQAKPIVKPNPNKK